jgi:hypothetical protein
MGLREKEWKHGCGTDVKERSDFCNVFIVRIG